MLCKNVCIYVYGYFDYNNNNNNSIGLLNISSENSNVKYLDWSDWRNNEIPHIYRTTVLPEANDKCMIDDKKICPKITPRTGSETECTLLDRIPALFGLISIGLRHLHKFSSSFFDIFKN